MTLTLSLPPEIEAKLRECAAASGQDLVTLVREAVEEKFAPGNDTEGQRETPHQWEQRFDAWVAARRPATQFVDDARVSIYAGRGE